ncbi:MAG TPA: bifunctional adenosylcobinamide kinase/adenosylcobinamide-phosphate guanylyltransferase [Candidatus Brocadiia bacterium]|nr:bifunctional adenosylcobinamide kinase/adenosylcobinamide-phosphate guanylyltransferase [Candidatus Brocadiales bacterium]
MAKIIFVLGGARSGKSAFAVEIAKNYKRVAYIATAQALDDEMAERIRIHKASRPNGWQVIESPLDADGVIKDLDGKVDFVLFDCITLYLTNLISREEVDIFKKVENLCKACRETSADVVIVSNEVGLGIVPENTLSRRFRDLAGKANQIIAKEADEVYFLVAGIAQKIK